MDRDVGPLIVAAGLVVVVIGALAWGGAFSWFGRLPGDVRYASDNVRVYFPLTSMLLASVVLSVVLSVFRR
jgi:NAD/NADP transhydrogenase beta subunit